MLQYTTPTIDPPDLLQNPDGMVPHLVSLDCFERAITHARRNLASFGTTALHVAANPADAPIQQAGRLLLLHSFTPIRMVDFSGETLMRAELPLSGHIACA